MFFWQNRLKVHLIFKETNIDINDRLCIKDDFASNINTHELSDIALQLGKN